MSMDPAAVGASSSPSRICAGIVLAGVVALLAIGCSSGPKADTSDGRARMYSFWPPTPSQPRMQYLTSFRFSSDIEKERSAFDELVFGDSVEVLPIRKPYGVDMWDGRIYVCDIKNPGVVILDLRQRQTRVMTTRGLGGMQQPTDLAIAPDGLKYVADLPRGLIFVFDAEDRHVNSFGEPGLRPVGVAVGGDELYVCDFETSGIVVMDRFTGEVRRSFGGEGPEDGKFARPLGIDVGPDGNIYVVDVLKCRLQKFSPEGELLFATGKIEDTPGNFVRPKHIAVDDDGIMYVVDAAFQNVQMFNDEGGVLMYFGSAGTHPGAMNLPAGICVHEGDLDLFESDVHPSFEPDRLLIVTNQFGPDKVAVYALGGLREGASLRDIAPVTAPMPTGRTADTEAEPIIPDITGEGADAGTEQAEPASPEEEP